MCKYISPYHFLVLTQHYWLDHVSRVFEIGSHFLSVEKWESHLQRSHCNLFEGLIQRFVWEEMLDFIWFQKKIISYIFVFIVALACDVQMLYFICMLGLYVIVYWSLWLMQVCGCVKPVTTLCWQKKEYGYSKDEFVFEWPSLPIHNIYTWNYPIQMSEIGQGRWNLKKLSLAMIVLWLNTRLVL